MTNDTDRTFGRLCEAVKQLSDSMEKQEKNLSDRMDRQEKSLSDRIDRHETMTTSQFKTIFTRLDTRDAKNNRLGGKLAVFASAVVIVGSATAAGITTFILRLLL